MIDNNNLIETIISPLRERHLPTPGQRGHSHTAPSGNPSNIRFQTQHQHAITSNYQGRFTHNTNSPPSSAYYYQHSSSRHWRIMIWWAGPPRASAATQHTSTVYAQTEVSSRIRRHQRDYIHRNKETRPQHWRTRRQYSISN